MATPAAGSSRHGATSTLGRRPRADQDALFYGVVSTLAAISVGRVS